MTEWWYLNTALKARITLFCRGVKFSMSVVLHSLSTSIFKKLRNGYALKSQECLQIPRFNTRYMKDSLEYRGSTLWNTVHYNDQEVGHLRYKDLKGRLTLMDCFKDFNFDIVSVSTA